MGQFQDGVAIEGALAQFNLVEGNSIIENGEGLELIDSINNFIGGTASGAGNVISGNRGSGVRITGSVLGDQILGNVIGTDSSGQNAVPNGVDGVDFFGIAGNTIDVDLRVNGLYQDDLVFLPSGGGVANATCMPIGLTPNKP